MPKAAIKPGAVSPLWILTVLRAVRAIQSRLMPSSRNDGWHVMPGLKAAHPDPDRIPGKWSQSWHETVRKRAASAWESPLLTGSSSTVACRLDPTQIAQSELAPTKECLPSVAWGLPVSEPIPSGMSVVGWRLPATPEEKTLWPPALLEHLVAHRAAGTQAWLIVPPTPEGWGWWSEARLRDSLRWGASWWFDIPANPAHWESYATTLMSVVRRMMSVPELDQWVWPCTDVLQQALEEILRTGSLNSRGGAPWGVPGRSEEWARLRKQLWAVAQETSGGVGALEDLTAGLVFEALSRGSLP